MVYLIGQHILQSVLPCCQPYLVRLFTTIDLRICSVCVTMSLINSSKSQDVFMSCVISIIKGSAPSIVRLLVILILCADLSAATEERTEINSQEEAAWREQGFSPSDAGEWKYFGIVPHDARKWVGVGIQFSAWANQWIGEGFSPEE